MNSSEIEFDSDLTMDINIDQQQQSVILEISDSLAVSEEELQISFKQKIANFINSSKTWYPLSIERIFNEDSKQAKPKLMTIYILSEQNVNSIIFGLLFRVEIDIEHGRGLKMDGETLKILEYGTAEVSFS